MACAGMLAQKRPAQCLPKACAMLVLSASYEVRNSGKWSLSCMNGHGGLNYHANMGSDDWELPKHAACEGHGLNCFEKKRQCFHPWQGGMDDFLG